MPGRTSLLQSISVMIQRKPSLFLFLFLACTLSLAAQQRTAVTLSEGWKFKQGATKDAQTINLKDASWDKVSVPHDWAIAGPFILDGNGSTGKLPWQGEAWYRRDLKVPASAAGQRMYLIFDGVMAFPKVYVNGKLAGEWDYGYNSFYVDITDFVTPGGKNVLAVHADTRNFDSRWYPGAGIYRKVQLLTVAPVHVAIWGTYVTTPVVKPNYADVRISTQVNNHGAERANITVEHEILSDGGQVVAKGTFGKWIKAGQQSTLETTLTVLDPIRWNVDNPYLYRLLTRVQKDGVVVDEYTTNFGVRTIRFDPDYGFYLNDRRVQLKGVNLHHDHGPLGSAFYPRAMERQLEIMKSMGVNAIRNSHNVAAPELLEMCDRMGLLFFDEAFDKYDAKAGILEDTDFETFAQRNIHNFIVRDRNHPCVFLWSVGNEIPDVQNNDNNGFQRLHTMVNYVRKYDPTRPVTLVNDQLDNAERRHFDYYDVHSWNYGRRYRLARQMEPNKSVIISESASTLSTRGFYEFPLPEDKTAVTKSLQVSSYDLHAPWWAEIADDDFMWQQDEPYIAGEFVWTGFDYLGEPTPYDNNAVKEMGFTDEAAARSSYFGIVDLVGIPKDRYYLYKSYWLPEENMIHILPHWNWPERVGEKVPVFVYTNGDEAELFLNGKSQGRRRKQPKSDNSVDRFRLMWNDVIYESGELLVVAYKAGRKIGEQRLQTAGEPTQLRLTPDRKTISKNGQDLSYVLVEALDANGNLAPLAMDKIQLELTGAGTIAGVGNGNPQSFAPFQASEVALFYGKAMVILKGGQQAGKMTLKATAPKLTLGETVIGVE